ncbi:hypothetical protein NLK91_13335 [Klebsiella pneumoniae]|uniref:hypothetical protein n=1 Tax=Klebsiella pneumoniae TaxID=573 RepID=UPI0021D1D6C0|nr:hypothetical protein [Klebsiella pneumoniae]MCU6622717.1 hypothetical protein [Klebsiella pneumoniae]
MTKSTITREQAQKIIVAADEVITALAGTNEDVHPDDSKKMCELWDDLNDRHAPPVVVRELARMVLAAMDSEPHTDDELSNLLWYSQEATCHSDPNYYCEFQRLATPGLIAWIIRELQERRKADSEPVRNPVLAYADSYRDMAKQGVESVPIWSIITDLERNIAPLYRHAQQPVVPEDVLAALQKVARISLDMNDFDGDRRGIADCLGDAEEALIEVVNRRAAMLHAGNSPAQSDCCPAQSPIDHGYRPGCECSGCKATARICADLSANSPANPGCWCRTCRPVVLNDMRFVVCPDCGNKRCPRANDHRNSCTGSNEPGQEGSAFPSAPQEVK